MWDLIVSVPDHCLSFYFSYLMYLDAINLYGWAISQPLPKGGFKWLKEDKWDDIYIKKKELDILLHVI